MQIRKAEESDLVGINNLLYQVEKIHFDGRPDIFKTGAKKYTDNELIEIINNKTTPIFVATNGNLIVGYAFCVYQITKNSNLLQDKNTLYIDDICVDKNCRGQGVGKSLYSYVENYAIKNNFDNITLNVWAFNKNAYNFYKKMGMNEQKTIMEKILR